MFAHLYPPVILTGGRPTQGGRTEWKDPDDVYATMLHQGVLTRLWQFQAVVER
jgi:hypothetical protein